MRIVIQFTGLFRALAGVERDHLDVAEGTTVDQLSAILTQKYKKLPLERGKTYFIVNGQVTGLDQTLAEGDQVRVFRLLAGG